MLSFQNARLTRLGTPYGGWTYLDHDGLNQSIIVSCGLGEDASFDVEFACRHGATVIIVDPTPRAITHFTNMMGRLGSSPTQPFVPGGQQSVQAYDLSRLRQGQLMLVDRALWCENTKLRFYLPRDPTHVSHSIVNFQNDYAPDAPFIEVEAITIDALLVRIGVKQLELIKMDIEGAETEVLADMLKKNIFPSQILVEYDELSKPTSKSIERIQRTHDALLAAGYRLFHQEQINFTYVRS